MALVSVLDFTGNFALSLDSFGLALKIRLQRDGNVKKQFGCHGNCVITAAEGSCQC